MTALANAKVENYLLMTARGDTIRTATRVILANGETIAFTQKMSRRRAIQQAASQLSQRNN